MSCLLLDNATNREGLYLIEKHQPSLKISSRSPKKRKIIRIFPNRLIGAVLMDIHEEWLSSTRKYIKFDQ